MSLASATAGRALQCATAGLLLLVALSSGARLSNAGAEPTPTPVPGVAKPAVPWPAPPLVEQGVVIGPREGALPRTGQVEVAVELSDPPAARAYALAQTVLRLPDDVAQRLAAQYAQHLDAAQLTLLAALTAPPINAAVLGRTQWTLNSILIRVDAAHLDAIRALPGVIAVRPLRIGQLTENAPVPGPLTPAKPLPVAPVAPGRPDGAMVY